MEGIPIEIDNRIGYILCCLCGTEIEPNPSNMCVSCIRTKIDITEQIPKQATLHFCKGCERYLQPPNEWMTATLESKELLSLCLRNLKGLNKVKLVDAGFIWTEPHSKRLKVKLTVQAEIEGGAKLQQVFVVEYMIANQMCNDCHRHEAQNFWRANVQVRQKCENKKTIFYLEQIILKHKAHNNTLGIKQMHGGLDFFFAHESHARKLVDFLSSALPIRYQHSKKLISHDIHSNTYNYKYTFGVEIVPISKGSLVCLSKELAHQLGAINPLCLVTRVTNTIQIIDPITSQIAEITSTLFWRHPFYSIFDPKQLTEYTVMNVDRSTINKKKPGQGDFSHKHSLVDVWLVKSSQLGYEDEIHAKTHLGYILSTGDTVLCYDLMNHNINDTHFEKLKEDSIPSLIVAKKVYTYPKESKNRIWKLKHLNQEGEPSSENIREFNEFLNDIEEDGDMRSNINIYKNQNIINQPIAVDENADDYDEYFPKITLAEMLDDLTIEDTPMEECE